MVSRRTRVVSWIFRRDHPSRPKAMICCFFSSFKTFAMLRQATDPPAAVNVLDVSSESMAAFGCSWGGYGQKLSVPVDVPGATAATSGSFGNTRRACDFDIRSKLL